MYTVEKHKFNKKMICILRFLVTNTIHPWAPLKFSVAPLLPRPGAGPALKNAIVIKKSLRMSL